MGFLVSDAQGRPIVLDAFEPFGADGRSAIHSGHVFDAYRNWLMLREWLSDLQVVVTHVFVSAEIRQLLLDYARQSPEFSPYEPLAARILRPHPLHTDHFHVRIACPSDQSESCVDSPAPP